MLMKPAIYFIAENPLLALNHSLDELLSVDERQGKIVEVKFFGGLSPPEISEALGISLGHRRPRVGDGTGLVASPNGKDRIAMLIEHWERVKDLLHQVMQLAPEER